MGFSAISLLQVDELNKLREECEAEKPVSSHHEIQGEILR